MRTLRGIVAIVTRPRAQALDLVRGLRVRGPNPRGPDRRIVRPRGPRWRRRCAGSPTGGTTGCSSRARTARGSGCRPAAAGGSGIPARAMRPWAPQPRRSSAATGRGPHSPLAGPPRDHCWPRGGPGCPIPGASGSSWCSRRPPCRILDRGSGAPGSGSIPCAPTGRSVPRDSTGGRSGPSARTPPRSSFLPARPRPEISPDSCAANDLRSGRDPCPASASARRRRQPRAKTGFRIRAIAPGPDRR